MPNYDHDQTLTHCDGCDTPSEYLTDVCGYEFCDTCIEEQAERAQQDKDFEEAQRAV